MKKMPRSSLSRRSKSQAGAVAIEFALIFPVLLFIYFGLIGITQYAFATRRVHAASKMMAETVALSTALKSADLEDYAVGVELMFKPIESTWVRQNVGVDVFNFKKGGGGVTRWTWFYGGSKRCTAPDSSSTSIATSLASSDVLVVVTCMTYASPVGDFQFDRLNLGYLKSKRIEKSWQSRPRMVEELNCTDC